MLLFNILIFFTQGIGAIMIIVTDQFIILYPSGFLRSAQSLQVDTDEVS